MATLNLHHLRLFHAVAADGTLTGAARRLNLSQSALSTQLRQLEATLGHALFERRGRGLLLTEAGRIAFDHAESIFRTAEDLTATLRDSERTQRSLRVGALATLSRNFQMQFLRPLLKRGDIEIHLQSGSQTELLRALEALALDVVLTNFAPAREATSPWLVHRLAEQPVSLIGTPGRVGPDRVALVERLASQPLVLPAKDTALRAAFDALAARLGVSPRIAAEADDMAMLRLLAREDLGLAVIPPIVVRDELATGVLLEAAKLETISEMFFAVTLERRFPNPRLADVIGAWEEGPE